MFEAHGHWLYVDAAMQLKAELYCLAVNEERRRFKNVYKLDVKDTFTVDQAFEEKWPIHRRVAIKNALVAAGLLD
jgi:hypothetical protein